MLKAENLQRVGAFKFRGAYNAVASLSDEERAEGITTVSSGDHAQALTLAARLHGTPAVILMPRGRAARQARRHRGPRRRGVRFDRYAQDREQLLAELVAERGLVPVHPYDDERVMAGQGTVALKLIEDAGPLDLLLVCVGGGGLISGMRDGREATGDMRWSASSRGGRRRQRSLEAGERVRIDVPRTIADGQQLPTRASARSRSSASASTGRAGQRPRDRRRDAVPVRADEDRRRAVGRVRARGAAGRPLDARGLRVGSTISGGNVSAERFSSSSRIADASCSYSQLARAA